ncbi:MAG: c-type cytochrome domain-containing protein, partial [Bryobacteraceae bacterium]
MRHCLPFLLFLVVPAAAQEIKLPPPADSSVDFVRDIEPLLKKRCQGCHGVQQQMSGLRLDLPEAAAKGGYSGPVIVSGKSAESKLIRMVAGAEKGVVMPPAGPRLSDKEVGLLRAWIDQGAKWPVPDAPVKTAQAGSKPDLWSLQP